MKPLKTQRQVIQYVQREARYFSQGFKSPEDSGLLRRKDLKKGKTYAVAGLGGRIYHANSPRDLVVMICKDLKIKL